MSCSAWAPRSDTGSDLDRPRVALSALKANLDPSLDLLRRRDPASDLPQDGLRRGCKQQRSPQSSARRRSRSRWRCASSRRCSTARATPTACPFTGSGYEDDGREDHARRPRQVPRDLVQAQQRHAGRRRRHDDGRDQAQARGAASRAGSQGDVPTKNLAHGRASPSKPVVYLVDQPGALQSVILAGQWRRRRNNPDEIAHRDHEHDPGRHLHLAPQHEPARGQALVVRRGQLLPGRARASGPFLAYAPVQTDKTKESMVEVMKELARSSAAARRPRTSWPRPRTA